MSKTKEMPQVPTMEIDRSKVSEVQMVAYNGIKAMLELDDKEAITTALGEFKELDDMDYEEMVVVIKYWNAESKNNEVFQAKIEEYKKRDREREKAELDEWVKEEYEHIMENAEGMTYTEMAYFLHRYYHREKYLDKLYNFLGNVIFDLWKGEDVDLDDEIQTFGEQPFTRNSVGFTVSRAF